MFKTLGSKSQSYDVFETSEDTDMNKLSELASRNNAYRNTYIIILLYKS